MSASPKAIQMVQIAAAAAADLTILLQPSSAYDFESLESSAKLLLDLTGIV